MANNKIIKFILTIIFAVLLILLMTLSFKFMNKQKTITPTSIRLPVVAGCFYPADKKILSKQIDEFLSQAKDVSIEGKPRILIVPHAGYAFSGQIAASAFNLLKGKNFKTVILIGPSHTDSFYGNSVDLHDIWQTPLGDVEVDVDLAKKLISENDSIFNRPQSHQKEHCIEVCLPFLQKTLKNFKIVPIIIGQFSEQNREALAYALSKYMDDQTLIVVSSDLSHYPSYETANMVDHKIIDAILTGKSENFTNVIENLVSQSLPGLDTCACGEEAIHVALLLSNIMQINDIKFLDYANSGDVSGNHSKVVGYVSIAFSDKISATGSGGLAKEEKQMLLRIARQSIEGYLKNGKIPEFKNVLPSLKHPQGAFVTLTRDNQLRGCIGRIIEKKQSLYQVVSKMAVSAAVNDNRFLPVSLDEMKNINIEISVLSPVQKIKNPIQEIEIGKHGVIVQQGVNSGVFLPQVATENNWGLEEFMGQLCQQKAGLPRDAWKGDDIDIYVFTAEVFSE